VGVAAGIGGNQGIGLLEFSLAGIILVVTRAVSDEQDNAKEEAERDDLADECGG
jgi:hypothetical protein